MALPVGSRFHPTDVGLVRSYLRNMVERKQSSFITTMDFYKDEPMTEYTLPKSREFQALVLCHIRLKKSTEDKKLGFVNHVPLPQPQPLVAETNNVVSNQLVQEEADFADELEEMMLQAEDGDGTQQQEEEIPILPPVQSNENNGVMMTYQELREVEVKIFEGKDGEDTKQQLVQEEADFADELEALELESENGDDTQQQEEEISILPPVQSNENNGGVITTRQEFRELEVKMLQGKDRDDTQLKQLQQEKEIQILPLHATIFYDE